MNKSVTLRDPKWRLSHTQVQDRLSCFLIGKFIEIVNIHSSRPKGEK